MNREILDKKDKLYRKSVALRSLAMDTNKEKGTELRKQQDEVYKKYQFYSNILKANDKIRLRDK